MLKKSWLTGYKCPLRAVLKLILTKLNNRITIGKSHFEGFVVYRLKMAFTKKTSYFVGGFLETK